MKQETIDLAPSWTARANTCIMLLEVGNDDARQTAKAEIRKMASILDNLDEKKDSHQSTQDSA